MRKLPLPVSITPGRTVLQACLDLLDEYIARVRAPRSDRLRLLRPTLTRRWSEYILAQGNPELYGRMTAFPHGSDGTENEDAKLLSECYLSGRGADAPIAAAVVRTKGNECPYCGIRFRRKPHDRADDKDHMSPRSALPEFSVLAVNLVSSCGDCNSAKSAKLCRADGKWLFIHPYFDEFLATRLIDGRVEMSRARSAIPVFVFEISVAHLNFEAGERVRRHVAELDILSRMQQEAAYEIQLLIDAQRLSGASVEDVRRIFAALAQERLAAQPNDPLAIAPGSFCFSISLRVLP